MARRVNLADGKKADMEISLKKAVLNDSTEIHKMQLTCFKPLLEKYRDFDTNPGNEPVERVMARIQQEYTDYYLIKMGESSIGGIRIVKLENGRKCRISPIFVLPAYQNKGVAQSVLRKIEEMYNPQNGWELETILEEEGNCHLYEKVGYKKFGEHKKINERMTLVSYRKGGET